MTWQSIKKLLFDPVPRWGWSAYFLCFVLEIILPVGQVAFAQRLQISVPQTTTSGTYVIYGRLSEEGVAVFEASQPWPKGKIDSSASTSTQAPVQPGSLGTRFTLHADERSACQDSPRVRGMLEIIKTLKKQISGVTLHYGDEWETCAKRIITRLGDVPYQVESAADGHEDGFVLLTRIASKTVPEDANVAVRDEMESASGSWRGIKLLVEDKVVPVNEEGWFAFLTPDLREHKIVMGRGGEVLFSQSVYPIPLSEKPFKVAGSKWYSERLVLLQQPLLDVSVVAVPALDRSYVIDAGLGLGFGYGREIPGEVKGQRLFTQGGLETRALFGPIGLKLMGSYTSAEHSVVPWTATARGLGFVDRSLWKGRMILRLGAGVEYFQAEIESVGGSLRTTSDVYIPEQVLAPLTLASVQSVVFEMLVVGLHGYYTPLYVLNIGKLYPSYNIVFELGVKLPGDWLVTIASGSETHRYPGLERDTRLNIDSSILSIKKGVF